MPTFRDRPVVRPTNEPDSKKGREIVDKISQMLPLSQRGSLVRAIDHNRSLSMILGINQMTLGVFRALDDFSKSYNTDTDGINLIEKMILPHLNVRDMLHTLRIYYDTDFTHFKKIEPLFSANNSAVIALHEENDAISYLIPLFQKELLRQHGLPVKGFFIGDQVNTDMLLTLRADLAVLLQPDLFNTSPQVFEKINGYDPNSEWTFELIEHLRKPFRVKKWRQRIWDIIEEPILIQTQSFIELATAVYGLSMKHGQLSDAFPSDGNEISKLGSQVTQLLKGVGEDTIRQFYIASVEFLTQLPKSMTKIPVEVLKALHNVERIVKIEEQMFTEDDLEVVRYHLLKIARLCGENG